MNLFGLRHLVISCVAIVMLAVVLYFVRDWLNRYYVAPSKLQRAYTSFVENKLNQAETEAWQAYQLNNQLTEAALLAAQIAHNSGRYVEASQYAAHLTSATDETRIKALRMLAQIAHYRTFQLSQAEAYYRMTLGELPDDVEAQTGLANLLGLCGRKAEAIPIVLNLVRLGAVSDLLMLLAREDAVVNDPALIDQARQAAPEDPLPRMAQAWHAANDGQYAQAIAGLREAQTYNSRLAPIQLLIIRYLAASGQFDDLRSEIVAHQSSRAEYEPWADYWLACGQLAEFEQRLPEAIRCYGEAAQRAPDSKIAIARLAALLHRTGDDKTAQIFQDYTQDLQTLRDVQERILFGSQTGSRPVVEPLLDAYIQVGRVWEALGWSRLAGGLNPRIAKLEAQTSTLPLSLVPPELSPCRHLDLASYPVPTWSNRSKAPYVPLDSSRPNSLTKPTASITFRNDASTAALDFHYHNGVRDKPARRMFEFPGGGIGILDLDQDGRPDIATAQGTNWPPESNPGPFHDVVFRNLDGQRFQPIPYEAIGFRLPDGFGQGIAVGDVNSDGFPDLYIAETGQNHLLLNNGDGTFQEVTTTAKIADQQWTTSCLIADITGDGLPDIYDVNYVAGRDVFDRVCSDHTGQAAMCMPGDFDAAQQVLWVNQGDGTFIRDAERLSPAPHGKGLGALAFAPSGQARIAGLSLLVSNDTTPNFLYVPTTNANGQTSWTDVGVVNGLAFNGSGKAQGSMGIAADDINGDGQLDFVITNFLNESSTYYSSQPDQTYSDDSVAANLIDPTRNVLGFGAQFIDADNDGASELFTSNGHIDDLRRRDVPFEMPPQLFEFRASRFQLLSAQALGDYFQQQFIGRSAARIDWNADGRQDLVVGHLSAPYALLTNTSNPVGHWLTVQLVGTRSSRDAVGTQVKVTANQSHTVRQLTAGDGYMASNQRHLHFGLGSAEVVDRLEIVWPSGGTQLLEHIPADRELLIVERLRP